MSRPKTFNELVALIPADQARRIVARAIINAGSDPEWSSETIEYVLEPFLPVVRKLVNEHGVPHPFNDEFNDEDGSGYWALLDCTDVRDL
jgi:hypothetical protein